MTSGAATTRLVLVTGLSGAGKSSALRILEDVGYEAVDNLPLALLTKLPQLDAETDAKGTTALTVAVDSRTRDFTPEALVAALEEIESREHLSVRLLFIDCDDEVLGRRFTETRRRHPLATDRPVRDGIEHERKLVSRLRYRADVVIDTSQLSVADLRHLIAGHFAFDEAPGMAITVTSFAYRRGLPREADLVFDVRFLANPHYVDALRPLTGQAPEVGEFIARDPAFQPFFQSFAKLVSSLLPHFAREGKSYLTVAIGCSGGRHRSVYVAERFARLLREEQHRVTLRHRDMDAPASL